MPWLILIAGDWRLAVGVAHNEAVLPCVGGYPLAGLGAAEANLNYTALANRANVGS